MTQTPEHVTRAITVRNMSCDHCVRAVERAVRAVPGVASATVTLGEVVVVLEGAKLDDVRAAIRDAGYEAE